MVVDDGEYCTVAADAIAFCNFSSLAMVLFGFFSPKIIHVEVVRQLIPSGTCKPTTTKSAGQWTPLLHILYAYMRKIDDHHDDDDDEQENGKVKKDVSQRELESRYQIYSRMKVQ